MRLGGCRRLWCGFCAQRGVDWRNDGLTDTEPVSSLTASFGTFDRAALGAVLELIEVGRGLRTQRALTVDICACVAARVPADQPERRLV